MTMLPWEGSCPHGPRSLGRLLIFHNFILLNIFANEYKPLTAPGLIRLCQSCMVSEDLQVRIFLSPSIVVILPNALIIQQKKKCKKKRTILEQILFYNKTTSEAVGWMRVFWVLDNPPVMLQAGVLIFWLHSPLRSPWHSSNNIPKLAAKSKQQTKLSTGAVLSSILYSKEAALGQDISF